MRHCTRFALAALIVLCSVSVVHAIPQLINYQGILLDNEYECSVRDLECFRGRGFVVVGDAERDTRCSRSLQCAIGFGIIHT